MRFIIIDNYDSYTFNLYSLFTIGGETPCVIRNNQFTFAQFETAIQPYFDAIIISPGPGSPCNTKDFGICAQVIDSAVLPIFAVCLGHQGVALQEGASITLGEHPYHGEISQVFHSNTDIFIGLPSPFLAVRYHSLVVSRLDLPKTLLETAWCQDDESGTVCMALKHKTKPIWTTQFHPESISTQFGREIADNFIALAMQWNVDVLPEILIVESKERSLFH